MRKILILAAVLPLALHAAPRLECDEIRGKCVNERTPLEPIKITAKAIVVAVIEPVRPKPNPVLVVVPPPKHKPDVLVVVPPEPTTVYIAPQFVPVTKAPELATGGIVTALTLLFGAIAVLRGRRQSRA